MSGTTTMQARVDTRSRLDRFRTATGAVLGLLFAWAALSVAAWLVFIPFIDFVAKASAGRTPHAFAQAPPYVYAIAVLLATISVLSACLSISTAIRFWRRRQGHRFGWLLLGVLDLLIIFQAIAVMVWGVVMYLIGPAIWT